MFRRFFASEKWHLIYLFGRSAPHIKHAEPNYNEKKYQVNYTKRIKNTTLNSWIYRKTNTTALGVCSLCCVSLILDHQTQVRRWHAKDFRLTYIPLRLYLFYARGRVQAFNWRNTVSRAKKTVHGNDKTSLEIYTYGLRNPKWISCSIRRVKQIDAYTHPTLIVLLLFFFFNFTQKYCKLV